MHFIVLRNGHRNPVDDFSPHSSINYQTPKQVHEQHNNMTSYEKFGQV